jgi:putative cell wall-binding protein
MTRMLVGVLAALLALAGFAAPAHAAEESAEWDYLARMNQARSAAGLGPLSMVAALRDAARSHSQVMANGGALIHTANLAGVATAGITDWTRAAENVGVGGDIPGLDQAFMASSSHRQNIMGDYRYVGVGVIRAGTSLWITVDFVQGSPGHATVAPPAPAPAPALTPAVPVTRLAGAAAADTALAVSRQIAAGSAEAVIVGRNDVFADALAGGPLAAAKGGSVLLSQRDVASPGLVDEARRVLEPGGTVYLLGGPVALGDAVERAFVDAGLRTERLYGEDRYATAVAVARVVAPAPSNVLLVSGTNFADAMVAGPVASKLRAPILLVAPEGVPAATSSHLASFSQARRTVVGGPAAVSDAAYAAAGAAERVYGGDRYETSVRVAQRWWTSVQQLSLATGASFQDALAGAAWSARTGIPLVLVSSDPGPAVRSYVDSVQGGLLSTIVYGGVAAVSDTVLGSLFN